MIYSMHMGSDCFPFSFNSCALVVLSDSGKHFAKKTIDHLPHPLVVVAFIWYLTPFLVWCFSHISEVNLFKERYFIPKEAGLVVLVTFHKQIFESLGFLKAKVLPKILLDF